MEEFETTVQSGDRGRVFIVLPFDPTAVWGRSRRHYVKATVNGYSFRGSLGVRDGAHFMPLNKDVQQGAGVGPGSAVRVTMDSDEAQEQAPDDFGRALDGAPAAKSFFEGLTAFYRNQYVGWVTQAKREEVRAARVREAIAALEAGKKQHS